MLTTVPCKLNVDTGLYCRLHSKVEATLVKKGMVVKQSRYFPGVATASYVKSQLQWAKKEARKVAAPSLSAALLEQINILQKETNSNKELQGNGVDLGGLYCLVAQRATRLT